MVSFLLSIVFGLQERARHSKSECFNVVLQKGQNLFELAP